MESLSSTLACNETKMGQRKEEEYYSGAFNILTQGEWSVRRDLKVIVKAA